MLCCVYGSLLLSHLFFLSMFSLRLGRVRLLYLPALLFSRAVHISLHGPYAVSHHYNSTHMHPPHTYISQTLLSTPQAYSRHPAVPVLKTAYSLPPPPSPHPNQPNKQPPLFPKRRWAVLKSTWLPLLRDLYRTVGALDLEESELQEAEKRKEQEKEKGQQPQEKGEGKEEDENKDRLSRNMR